MIIKTTYGHSHADALENILQSVRIYDMRLNPAKFSLGVQAGKFMRFMLTRRGIESDSYKFQAVINMRIPTNVKEVQQLTGRLTALSHFLSCMGDIAFLFFFALRKMDKFEWTPECEEAFTKIKEFLMLFPILTRSREDSPLLFYLSITERSMISVLVQEIDKAEKPVYFISKMFKGDETRYHKIEKLVLVVVTTTRKL